MSRVGKKPVVIPSGVTVQITGNTVMVKGPKGELKKDFHLRMQIESVENSIVVKRPSEEKSDRALHGLTRNLIANMVEGVTKGYSKKLEIIGVGYKAQPNKNKITLNLGFSHPIEYVAPVGIEFKADGENKNIITIEGIDKQTVGEVAAKVRSFKEPEPYKGKGIKYIDEKIVRKAGKAAGAGAK
ncbi:MAG: 50S ribosomal protein L6 [Patescibacteria group bacterium]